MYNDLNPRKIIYSEDCTIVFWNDGTKTIVRRSKGTKDDKHSAFCAALAKKVFNTNSELKRKIKVAENAKRIKPNKKNCSLFNPNVFSKEVLYSGCIRCGVNASKFCPDAFTEKSPGCSAYNRVGKYKARKLDDFSRPVIPEELL